MGLCDFEKILTLAGRHNIHKILFSANLTISQVLWVE